MPRYYCDYCDTYLTHDSPSVRKQHNAGYKHKANVRAYYQQFEEQQTQSLIDQRVREHLGQSFQQQVGAAFHQHLVAMQSGQRPRPPMGQPPLMAGPRPSTMPNMQQMPPSLCPVGLPTPPIGSQGFSFPMGPSPMIPPATAVTAPPGVTPTVTQPNGLFRPPAMTTPGSTPPLTSIPASAPLSNGTPADHASATSGTYQSQQSNSVFTSTGYGTYNYSAPPTIYPQQSSS